MQKKELEKGKRKGIRSWINDDETAPFQRTGMTHKEYVESSCLTALCMKTPMRH